MAFPTKESERERESSPQTPFIEKGKGKENKQNKQAEREDDYIVHLSQAQMESIRQNNVTQGNANCSKWEARQANSTKDKVVAKVEGGLKCPEGFQRFLNTYPNRWGLDSNGRDLLEHAWNGAIAQGWSDAAILEALEIAQKEWNALKKQTAMKGKRFIPNADKFLSEEWMRTYLPKEQVAKLLGETLYETKVALIDEAAFEEFCAIYPTKRDLSDDDEKMAVRMAWRECEEGGWSGSTMLQALKEAIVSKLWNDEQGRFIPSALRFLKEEKMRQFLPMGFQPRGYYTPSAQPEEHEFDPMAYGLV